MRAMSTVMQKSPAELLATPVQFLKGVGPQRAGRERHLFLPDVRAMEDGHCGNAALRALPEWSVTRRASARFQPARGPACRSGPRSDPGPGAVT